MTLSNGDAQPSDDVSRGDDPSFRGASQQLHANTPSSSPSPVTDASEHGTVASVSPAFSELLSRLEPECRALIAEYEDSRSALLPIIHRFQDEEGYVSPAAIAACAQLLALPPSIVESTVSFYTLFFRRPIGKYMLQVCRNLSCSMNGAEEIMAAFREQLGIGHLETTADGLFSYEEVECLAACDRAPCMQVNLDFVFDLTHDSVATMLVAIREGRYPTKPLRQTVQPGRTWHVSQDSGKKSPGALGVSHPNAPGGIGDRSGREALARIVGERAGVASRTHERLVVDGERAAEGASP